MGRPATTQRQCKSLLHLFETQVLTCGKRYTWASTASSAWTDATLPRCAFGEDSLAWSEYTAERLRKAQGGSAGSLARSYRRAIYGGSTVTVDRPVGIDTRRSGRRKLVRFQLEDIFPNGERRVHLPQ